MILVIGATGVLGTEICRQLTARGLPVRAFARPTSARLAELTRLGVEIFHGDLRNAADIGRACRGAAAVISTATAMGSRDKSLTLRAIDREAQLAVVAAASAAGVERFVYISASPNLPATSPLIRYKREVERVIRASGMRWTILQPSCFMEIWLGEALGWDIPNGRASIFGRGDRPIAWISVKDVAAYAVRALEDPRLENQVVPLGGPEAIPPNAVVRLFEERAGRPFAVRRTPRALLVALGPLVARFNEGAGSGMALGARASLGDEIDSPLQEQLGVPRTSVREYVERTLGR